MRPRLYSLLAGFAALAAAGIGNAGAAEPGGGMPQLDYHDFPPQIVWLAISFVVLYAIMSKLAIPRIAGTLEKRQGKIQGDLDAAEKASEETRQLVDAYEKRLADAREAARRLQRDRSETDSAEATARLAALGEKLGAQVADAEKRIESQRSTAVAGLEQMAGEIAASAYAKLSGQTADEGALGAKVASAARETRR
jgi:F-type H+-transporting ATPase subunit b